jgi:membrane associated rhomboid family serine protease
MILPLLDGLRRFRDMPITWVLFFIQLLVFLWIFSTQNSSLNYMTEVMDDDDFLKVQGAIYAQMIHEHPARTVPMLRRLAEQARQGSANKNQILGSLAFRDEYFLSQASGYAFQGDRVQFADWKKKFDRFLIERNQNPSHHLGVHDGEWNLSTWLTYQFTHSGFLHFATNMWFLLILGAILEPVYGGLFVFLLFVFSGIVGAEAFILLSGLSGAPLVGASGAVSGLMAFAVGMNFKKPSRFWYWLLPHPSYTGIVYLPMWVLLSLWMISDIAGLLSTIEEIGGVAHAAHMGGVLTGFVAAFGLTFFRWSKSSAHRIFGHTTGL